MSDIIEEKTDREIRKVTEALKKLSSPPSALLFLEAEMMGDWNFDIPDKVQGLPIYFSGNLLNRAWTKRDEYRGIPWVPVWNTPGHYDNIREFNETYLDTE